MGEQIDQPKQPSHAPEIFKEYGGVFTAVGLLIEKLESLRPEQEVKDTFTLEVFNLDEFYIPEAIKNILGTPDSIDITVRNSEDDDQATLSIYLFNKNDTVILSRSNLETDSAEHDSIINHASGVTSSIDKLPKKEFNQMMMSFVYPSQNVPTNDLEQADFTNPQAVQVLREMLPTSSSFIQNESEYLFQSSDTLFHYFKERNGAIHFDVRYFDEDNGWNGYLHGINSHNAISLNFRKDDFEVNIFDTSDTRPVISEHEPKSTELRLVQKLLEEESAFLSYVEQQRKEDINPEFVAVTSNTLEVSDEIITRHEEDLKTSIALEIETDIQSLLDENDELGN